MNTMKKSTSRLALIITLAILPLVNVPAYASVTDDRIETAAKQSYVFKTFLKDDDITIESQDGSATLTGTVSDASHKSLASETVAGLPGVVGVDNKLQEKSEVPADNTDAWLINKVEATLLFHRNVNASKTEVLAKDGVVTLRGEADNTAQKDLATEYAKDVEGVQDVKNEMTTPTAADTKPGKTTMGQKMGAVGNKMGAMGDNMGDKMSTMGDNMGDKMSTMGDKIDDASITALVKTTLLYHRSTSALNTKVDTKDGVVNLAGKAKNAAEKDLATKVVSDVHGVKMVVNNMTVDGIAAKTN
jgi:osmotically-inducible protein OsmY